MKASIKRWTDALLLTSALAAMTVASAASAPADLVDALNLVFGKQKENRAVHAKGSVLEGKFTPSAQAKTLSKAPHLQNASVPVTVRFSDFAGLMAVSDTDPLASPRGLALKFHLPDGSDTDLVTHSFNGFPTPTADDFRQFLIALGTSPPGTASPTPAEKYLGAHPVAKTFLATQQGPPVSFATLTYFGVNSFKFTNAAGKSVFARYRIEPAAGNQLLTKEQVAAAAPDYLSTEIRKRVASGPIRFTMSLQLAEQGDRIDDPSIAWPESRRKVPLGTLEIERAVAESATAEKALMFIPSALPAGIEPADPMIDARSAAYPVSFSRRHQ